jgi:glutaredoxin-like YruB-family protein
MVKMDIVNVSSHTDFLAKAGESGRVFLMLFRKGSEQSECAMHNLLNATEKAGDLKVFAADVSEVRDIHTEYGVTTVPSLLAFRDARLTGIVKGCQETGYYRAMTENAFFRASAEGETAPARRVTVYSTPACSWCNTLKSWLKQNGINYTDIDVSRDQRAAEELVKRTGQQGVPQTDINGEIVVGFNQPRLKQLLGI